MYLYSTLVFKLKYRLDVEKAQLCPKCDIINTVEEDGEHEGCSGTDDANEYNDATPILTKGRSSRTEHQYTGYMNWK